MFAVISVPYLPEHVVRMSSVFQNDGTDILVLYMPLCVAFNSEQSNSLPLSALLFPCTDDSISAASTSDVQDRLSALELRVQQQEDEITVLKAALADVLRRLAISEDHVASVRKSAPSKGKAKFGKLFLASGCVIKSECSPLVTCFFPFLSLLGRLIYFELEGLDLQ